MCDSLVCGTVVTVAEVIPDGWALLADRVAYVSTDHAPGRRIVKGWLTPSPVAPGWSACRASRR